MTIEDSRSAMQSLADTGVADLQLSAETRDKYVNIVTTLRDSLAARVGEVQNLPDYGNTGSYGSAEQTKANLELGAANFIAAMNNYIDYLDAFSETVTKACDRALEQG
jgi:hypothetical protein